MLLHLLDWFCWCFGFVVCAFEVVAFVWGFWVWVELVGLGFVGFRLVVCFRVGFGWVFFGFDDLFWFWVWWCFGFILVLGWDLGFWMQEWVG